MVTYLRRFLLIAFCLVLAQAEMIAQNASSGQAKTISGYIEDGDNGERLIGANVLDRDALEGASSNSYGFFSYTYTSDTLRLRVSYIGFQAFDTVIIGKPQGELLFQLGNSVALETVEVLATEQSERIDEQVQMSKVEVPIEQIKRAPALLGETDVLKALQLLPGVQSGSEGTAGLYVRGGSPDQNLVLLDGVPVYNVSHVLGIFSVFNADAINNVTLTKGGFPARFGGRLSSVLEINMKDGHKDEWHGEGGIGIISSRLTLNGPVGKKTRVLVSGRRTYLDLLAKPFIASANNRDPDFQTKLKLNFFDLNTKIRHDLNDKHRIYASGYLGGDVFQTDFRDTYDDGDYDNYGGGINWGNTIAAVRWNWELGPRLFSNTTATFSDYQINFFSEFESQFDGERESFGAIYKSGIRDIGLKYDLDFIPNPKHYIRLGGGVTHHTYSPGATTLQGSFTEVIQDTVIGQPETIGIESWLYAEDEWKINKRLWANVGIHASAFNSGKTYMSVQPRAALRYRMDNGVALKASYAQMTQFVNLLTSEALALPTDLWVPSTKNVLPQQSWQAAIGAAKVWNDKYEISVEAFYKNMDNVVSYRPGASFFDFDATQSWEDKITQGNGKAYGLEVLVQRKIGRTTGWLGYTLSWNNRSFDEINGGETFAFRYDRRHDLSLLVTHELSDRIILTGAWVYGSGNAFTLPEYSINTDWRIFNQGQGNSPSVGFSSVQQGIGKNQYRMSDYHRLDLSVEFIKKKKWGERAWVLGCYNAYWNRNPFFVLARDKTEFDPNTGASTRRRVVEEVSILPIVPSISYRFKF